MVGRSEKREAKRLSEVEKHSRKETLRGSNKKDRAYEERVKCEGKSPEAEGHWEGGNSLEPTRHLYVVSPGDWTAEKKDKTEFWYS